MEFEIIEALRGRAAHLYTVWMDGSDETLLDEFFRENAHRPEAEELMGRLVAMVNDTGFRRQFFKEGEGSLGDGICALRDGRLRLYCLYFDRTAVIFGSGGYKPEGVRAYQEVPLLNEKAQQMRKIAARINQAIIERELKIEEDGTLTGNNIFEL